MKCFDWDDARNGKLRAERGIGFEEIVFHIERGDVLDILKHPNPDRDAGQRIFVVRREDYLYLVPFVEDGVVPFVVNLATCNYCTHEPKQLSATLRPVPAPAPSR